ncbi:phosphopentomutase [uncultured Ruegeria sp.]|uniref:phosphopentomutase n=1 Tax=uncultured Ruegeria sp. TaxID=259304 RepID=UPI002626E080|nr:phosphopentomutase [uncultured Ruegeria sp.]
MPRALLFVLDSVGIGGAPDAAQFGDEGSNTLGHIYQSCQEGGGDLAGSRKGPLYLPNLARMGLGEAANLSVPGSVGWLGAHAEGAWAVGREYSAGKDTPSGHWEIAGVPVTKPWTRFPDTHPAFPKDLINEILAQSGLPGILGNKHASGILIIEELAGEHIKTGMPICYTSADSVFQIAAHEEYFGLHNLYNLCELVFELTAPLQIGRVIARPFVGDAQAGFQRTGNRRDYTVEPSSNTLLDDLSQAGRHTIGMGKIGDIFSGRGLVEVRKAAGNMALLDLTIEAIDDLKEGGFLFANFVDFDSEFGHQRDVPGYAAALEAFDRRLPEVRSRMRRGDLLVITADHGNDPTWSGTDHTREQVPILKLGGNEWRSPSCVPMSDIGASIADFLRVGYSGRGTSLLVQ